MNKYHYEYEARCDNLNYGGLFIGRYKTRPEAIHAARVANKGVYKVRKIRVYEV